MDHLKQEEKFGASKIRCHKFSNQNKLGTNLTGPADVYTIKKWRWGLERKVVELCSTNPWWPLFPLVLRQVNKSERNVYRLWIWKTWGAHPSIVTDYWKILELIHTINAQKTNRICSILDYYYKINKFKNKATKSIEKPIIICKQLSYWFLLKCIWIFYQSKFQKVLDL